MIVVGVVKYRPAAKAAWLCLAAGLERAERRAG
jgi:hypothetical protein